MRVRSFRLPEEVDRRIREAAAVEEISFSALVRQAATEKAAAILQTRRWTEDKAGRGPGESNRG